VYTLIELFLLIKESRFVVIWDRKASLSGLEESLWG